MKRKNTVLVAILVREMNLLFSVSMIYCGRSTTKILNSICHVKVCAFFRQSAAKTKEKAQQHTEK